MSEDYAIISLSDTLLEAGGCVAFAFTNSRNLAKDICVYLNESSLDHLPSEGAIPKILGSEFVIRILFPTSWGTSKTCNFLDSLSTLVETKIKDVSKRVGFPNLKPSAFPLVDRDDFETIPSFASWYQCYKWRVIYEKEHPPTVRYILEDDDDEDPYYV